MSETRTREDVGSAPHRLVGVLAALTALSAYGGLAHAGIDGARR
jgi:hypothetical protein